MTEKPRTIRFYRNRLPHWEVAEGRYFVTLRLAGSIPQAGIERIKQYGEQLALCSENVNEAIRLRQKIFRETEEWLDRVSNVDYLNNEASARIIDEAIRCRTDNGDWSMLSYVIMPNHLHLFFTLGTPDAQAYQTTNLKKVMNAFKRWTASQIKESMNIKGPFWQREWFDHWSRSHLADQRIIRYILNNPVKAGLVKKPEDWPFRSK